DPRVDARGAGVVDHAPELPKVRDARRRPVRPPRLRSFPVMPRGPRLYKLDPDHAKSGPGEPPPGFVTATTSATEWFVYWAVAKGGVTRSPPAAAARVVRGRGAGAPRPQRQPGRDRDVCRSRGRGERPPLRWLAASALAGQSVHPTGDVLARLRSIMCIDT